MTITREELVREFGAVTERGHSALFVGAGLSIAAGLPGWAELLKKPRRDAHVPSQVTDLPLVAEYYSREVAGGEERLTAYAIQVISDKLKTITPTRSHHLLASLPITETWTTNYDDLLERAKPTATVIAWEKDLEAFRSKPGPRIIKMHGGMAVDEHGRPAVAELVLTRGHFESYAEHHPRTWAFLRSTFLTKSMLFLGFSFDDPNIEIMLRLARSLDSPRVHYTVMRKPIKTLDQRLHDLRVRDLERSGISVYEVDSFDDIEPALKELMRRTRPPSIFISGSPQEEIGVDFTAACRAIGSRLAELPIALSSLAGKAAGIVSHAFAATLRQRGHESAAETIRFYFNSPGNTKPYRADVVGTQIYTQQTDDVLRRSAMKDCRVMVLIGGGTRTDSEVRIADDLGIPIVPVAATGGRARDYWERLTLENSGLPIPKAKLADAKLHWAALGENDVNAVALAVHRLAKWASYLE